MKIRKALGINALSQLIIFAVNFTSIVVISRLLAPEEIGIFSVSVSVLAFAHIFREFGVGQFLIQIKEVTRQRLRAAFTVTLCISWSIAVLLLLLRTPIAGFYGSPAIAEVIRLIAVNFVILPFGAPLLSLLRREMRFDKIAIVNISNTVVSTTVTIGAALAGESYLSMAWGAVAGSISSVVILNIMRRGQVFMLPAVRGLGEIMRFGSLSSAGSILSELGNSAPDLILGRTLGFAPVAYFSRANGLRNMALGQIITLVRGVYLPSFAIDVRAGQNPAYLYSRAMNYMIAFTAPALAVLAVMAAPLILFLFGPNWERSAPLATLLCAFAIFTTPTSMASTSLVACGKVGLLLRAQVVTQCFRILSLLSSIWLDLDQVVVVFSISYVIECIILLHSLRVAFNLNLMEFWRAVRAAYLIVPISIIGPVLIRIYDYFSPNTFTTLTIITASAFLFVSGWALGIAVTKHPLKMEASLLLAHLNLFGTREHL
ncbi:oligosaccharide flippase family protein [Aromatoleum aromaticum]|uniref:Exopolysaccharide export protein, possibly related with succinoglycan synthesis n=1 Tax=Aromatoleum aromaticum (strain DSM 19018 / LMG 30748 / EbN1) TaxID=76114 RepID=Q5P2A9_AROAE|nr:oligosaccharide flippase family protein [Aromatoleum aromaticum]NMG56087.1 oligosaccharide flippase family protein [Aromatoleum aromaticum]CAI08555.1 putative exopolysaccharide export protein, possibly related with succinoglycan synthesis [Aromatoleum aromaticum EbN1]